MTRTEREYRLEIPTEEGVPVPVGSPIPVLLVWDGSTYIEIILN